MMEGKEGQVRMAQHEREHQIFGAKFSVCLSCTDPEISWKEEFRGWEEQMNKGDAFR